MAKLELSEAVKALIAKEVDVIFGKSTDSDVDTGKHRSKRNRAVEDVVDNVATNLTFLAEHGFGICFASNDIRGFVETELKPIRDKALRAALLEHGIETDEDGDFIRFVDDEHRALAESRILDSFLLKKIADGKEGIDRAEKTIKDESAHKADMDAQIVGAFKILGKRSWVKDAQEAKRARTDDAGGVGGADA